jgi:hypothetical protein
VSADDIRIRELLADTLALWRVDGTVEPGEAPVVALVRAADGTTVWVERPGGHDLPLRWLVRWRAADEAPGGAREARPRACASLVGLLNAMRGALGVDRGNPVVIAPAPSDP